MLTTTKSLNSVKKGGIPKKREKEALVQPHFRIDISVRTWFDQFRSSDGSLRTNLVRAIVSSGRYFGFAVTQADSDFAQWFRELPETARQKHATDAIKFLTYHHKRINACVESLLSVEHKVPREITALAVVQFPGASSRSECLRLYLQTLTEKELQKLLERVNG